MTLKVKLRGNKAIVRFNNQIEESFFIHVIRSARDDGGPHPEVSLKGNDGREIPPRKPDKPLPRDQVLVERSGDGILQGQSEGLKVQIDNVKVATDSEVKKL